MHSFDDIDIINGKNANKTTAGRNFVSLYTANVKIAADGHLLFSLVSFRLSVFFSEFAARLWDAFHFSALQIKNHLSSVSSAFVILKSDTVSISSKPVFSSAPSINVLL